MYHMILLVLDQMEQCSEMLEAWDKAGAPGITILESTGLGRMKDGGLRDDIPFMPMLTSLLKGREKHHRTLFTVVDDEAIVDRIIKVTEEITGVLDNAHNGVLFVLPVTRVIGLAGAKARANPM